jgi:hypothetical protein
VPPKSGSRAVGRGISILSPARAAVGLRRLEPLSPAAAGQQEGEAGRTTCPIAGTRDTATALSRDHAGDGRRAVPRPGARRRALALRCDSGIKATLFAAKAFLAR